MPIKIRRNIYKPMQNMTFAAATHLILPQHDDSTTPTLAFGDANTGFYESADNVLKMAIAGGNAWIFRIGSIKAATTAGGGLLNETSTATNPSVIPITNDEDTGIGSAAADQLSLIAGGIEGLRITEANGIANMDIVCHEGAVVTHNDNVVTLN